MEVKPKISRNLILVVIFFFSILSIIIYSLLSSEKLTRWAILFATANFISNERLNVDFGAIDGCLLSEIKINSIDIKHVRPNFDAKIKDINFKPLYTKLLNKGAVQIVGSIGSVDWTGSFKLPSQAASIPAFVGTECFSGMPGNIRISSFDINNITIKPYTDADLLIVSKQIALKEGKDSDNLDVAADFKADWKSKPLAKALFEGIWGQKKNKLNGKIKLNIAKQVISSELSLGKGKKGLEVSGYIASDTQIDLLPLSQWLGSLWQIDYPYGVSGKLYCQGSWLYNSEIGFLGNLNGKYDKLDISVIGIFLSLLELNGNWKLFDGNLTFSDNGSRLIGFPASLNGNIESVTSPKRKWNLLFESNSIPLGQLTSSIPWMVKYSNGIPDLDGVATLSINLLGYKPMINAKLDLENLCQVSKVVPASKVSGKLLYVTPENGSGTINANFEASTDNGLPQFFKKFSGNFYELENSKKKNSYKYSVNGSLVDKVKLKGVVKNTEGKCFETNGELIGDKFYVDIVSNKNRVHRINSADPIDLLLMR